jgi:hypothetical protein
MNGFTICKELQCRYGIIADSRQAEAPRLQGFSAVLQLDQLALAEGSPIRRAVKDKHSSAGSTDLFEGLERAVLVRKSKRWYVIARF